MAVEIERKFLLKSDAWRKPSGEGTHYVQGYISNLPHATVRVRTAGDKGFLTIKGEAKADSIAHPEYEYEISSEDAQEMIDSLCSGKVVEKIRYRIPYEGHVWEIDEFLAANKGLIVAEVEMQSEDKTVSLPSWLGEEVTQDHRYSNAQLSVAQFSEWGS